MSDEKIEIDVLYSPKDFWRSHIGSWLGFTRIVYLFLGLAIYGMFISFLFLRKYIEISHLADVFLFAFLFTVFYGIVLSYFGVKHAKKFNNYSSKFGFSGENIEIKNKYFSSRMNWPLITRAKESKKYFTLYTGTGQGFLLPKRCFKGQEQISIFKNLIAEKVSREVYLIKSKENLGLR